MSTGERPGGVRARLRGVRVRSALAAAGVVALALVAGAGALTFLLQRSLIGAAASTAADRADAVATLIEQNGVTGLADALAARVLPGDLVQVLSANGSVIASTDPFLTTQPLADLRPTPGHTRTTAGGRLRGLDLDKHIVVAAQGVSHSGSDYVVLAAADLQPRQEDVARVAAYLFGGLPVLLLVVGGATFFFVGRSLQPVEDIRRRVAGIGAGRLAERVPVPDTDDEIERLALTMNSMLDRVQAAHDAQRRFIADASHELRSPLATMRVGLDLAERPGRTLEDWAETRAALSVECERMARLVDDLLLLAKADEHTMQPHVTDVDLDDLVGAEATRVRTVTTLTVAVQVEPVRVRGDAPQLARALRNLVDNAARHARSRVLLAVRTEGDRGVIEVRDDGPGVPAADRERIFDRFVRLEGSRSRSDGGSGLGLAIVQEIVSAHGGTVTVDDAPEGGACFRVRLPAES